MATLPTTSVARRWQKLLSRLAIGCALPLLPAVADQATQDVTVSARVMAVASLEWLGGKPALRISDADIARGYVELAQPALLRVHSNSREGYTLDLQPRGALFSSVAVMGLDGTAELGSDGGSIVQRWHDARSASLALQFRFTLAPGVAAGSYALPLELRVRPLAAGD